MGGAAAKAQTALLSQPAIRVEQPVADAAKAVIRHHEDIGFIGQKLNQIGRLPIELLVYLQDAVVESGWVLLEQRGCTVGVFPVMMADPVGLAEQDHEAVPRLALQKVFGGGRFLANRLE